MSANTYSHLPEVLSALLVAGSLLITTASNAAENEDTFLISALLTKWMPGEL